MSIESHEKLEQIDPEKVSLNIIFNESIVYVLPVGHISPSEVESIYSEDDAPNMNVMSAPVRLYPNGAGTATLGVTVTDQNGRPVPGVTVSFRAEAVRPTGGRWRSENGVVALYGSGSQAKARQRIRNGQIRLLGALSRSSVNTNSQGLAETVYTVSHIGGNQSQIGEEIVIATIGSSTTTSTIQIGYDWMADLPTVANGLRIVGATGRHIHRDLVQRIRDLGNAVAQAQWPQPVTITAGNLRWGGLYPPHFTHQWGAEIDLRPMTTDGNPGRWNSANYDRQRTQALVSALSRLGASTIYFNDPQIQGATPLAGHDDHLHASFASNSMAESLLKNPVSEISESGLKEI